MLLAHHWLKMEVAAEDALASGVAAQGGLDEDFYLVCCVFALSFAFGFASFARLARCLLMCLDCVILFACTGQDRDGALLF